jgi:CheY-like chemotaxis protein
MNGLEVVRRVRAGEAGTAAWDIWIVMVTADHRPEMRERALLPARAITCSSP